MHYYLFVCLERFYADTLARSDPKLAESTLIVHHNKKVLDLNLSAERAGVRMDMGLSEAKALSYGGTVVRWEEEPYREATLQWLDVCRDFSDVIEPEEQHSAYIDLSGHPDPSEIAWKLEARLRELGRVAHVGMGATKWIAKVAALYDRERERTHSFLDPSIRPEEFLSPLPTSYLLPISPLTRDRLTFLGYRTIGQVASIPLAVLQEQFGIEGILVFQSARGGVHQSLSPIYPPGTVAARVRFEGAIDDSDLLETGLKDLAGKLANALESRELQGNELQALVEFDEASPVRLSRRFMKPLQSPQSIFSALKLMTAGKLTTPISQIRVDMPRLVRAERFQRELAGGHTLAERQSSTVSAFSHIRTVFGDSAIEVAGQVRESRRRILMRCWKDATGWL